MSSVSFDLPVGARVARIQELMGSLVPAPAAPAAPAASGTTTNFASLLQQAQAPASPAGPASAAASGTPFGAEIDAAAAKYGIDPRLLSGLVRQESGFDPTARSSAGALGLTQLMPATAASLGVTDPTDPAQALEGGAKYLRQMLDRFGGDPRLALAAYNAGPGAVSKYGGVPPYAETQHYVENVLSFAGMSGGAAAVSSSPTANGVTVT